MTFGSRQSLKSFLPALFLFSFFCPTLFSAQKADSTSGVVVSGSSQSTEAGIHILKQGGTAADAAVAVSLTLGVTEPFNSGLGGKLVVLYYDASNGNVSYIDALETAPARDVGRGDALPSVHRTFARLAQRRHPGVCRWTRTNA